MLGHGVSSLTGADDALLSGFGGACGKGGCIAATLGVDWPKLSFGCSSFPLFCSVTFPEIRVSFWEWRSKLVNQCWDYWSHFVFHFQEGFHLFGNDGVQAEFCAPGCALHQLGCSIPSKNVHPLQ